ncbi:hypothetical protein GCM10011581_44060 [Saccharopolyspora subtropica]|uniref:Pectate lyase n=1 Tax=Saccharopolyspora thermophila TaxID=89367 RepID=A0A917K618_9PSEU|nr:hypothetical protein GCM10011581_44060 [Saccharopolyspora subtropica]
MAAAIEVGSGAVFDGNGDRYHGTGGLGDGGQGEGQPATVVPDDVATVSSVVIGVSAADGRTARGGCTLWNVVWEDLGEDATTGTAGVFAAVSAAPRCAGRHEAPEALRPKV